MTTWGFHALLKVKKQGVENEVKISNEIWDSRIVGNDWMMQHDSHESWPTTTNLAEIAGI